MTVGTGTGSGLVGTSASPGLFLPALKTTLSTPSAEKFGYRITLALWAIDPAPLSTELTNPTGIPGTNGRLLVLPRDNKISPTFTKF